LNLGVSDWELLWRKFLTFAATLVLLGITFLILYGLSVAQVQESANTYISLAISITIAIVNVAIAGSSWFIQASLLLSQHSNATSP